eukprot:4444407-Prymnesium_polylepis.1
MPAAVARLTLVRPIDLDDATAGRVEESNPFRHVGRVRWKLRRDALGAGSAAARRREERVCAKLELQRARLLDDEPHGGQVALVLALMVLMRPERENDHVKANVGALVEALVQAVAIRARAVQVERALRELRGQRPMKRSDAEADTLSLCAVVQQRQGAWRYKVRLALFFLGHARRACSGRCGTRCGGRSGSFAGRLGERRRTDAALKGKSRATVGHMRYGDVQQTVLIAHG